MEGLTSNDLGTVLEEVVDVSAQWYSLGLQLRVNVGALNRIRAQFSDPQDQLSAMLKIPAVISPGGISSVPSGVAPCRHIS